MLLLNLFVYLFVLFLEIGFGFSLGFVNFQPVSCMCNLIQ